jgi:hypothetical protein
MLEDVSEIICGDAERYRCKAGKNSSDKEAGAGCFERWADLAFGMIEGKGSSVGLKDQDQCASFNNAQYVRRCPGPAAVLERANDGPKAEGENEAA